MQAPRKPKEGHFTGYPMLSSPTLVECLLALGISSSIEDIEKPTAQTTISIWNSMINVFMGIQSDAYEGPKQTLLGMIEYKDIYNDSLQFLMFFKHCRRLANLCQIKDFSTNDIMRPTPTRLRVVLSGVMNFAKFRDERGTFVYTLCNRWDEEKGRSESLKNKLEKIEADIQTVTLRHAKDTPKVQELEAMNKKVTDQLLELRQKQMAVSADLENLKKEKGDYLSDLGTAKREEQVLREKNTNARQRLVRSPDRIKRNIGEMQSQVQNLRNDLANRQRKARDHASRLEIIVGLEAELKRLVDIERELDAQRIKIEELHTRRADLRSKVDAAKIEKEGLEHRRQQLDRQIKNAEEKLDRNRENTDKGAAESQRKIERLKKEYVERSTERKKFEKEVEALAGQQREIEARMKEHLDHHQLEINAMVEKYMAMRRSADDYIDTMRLKLNLPVVE